VKGVIQQNLFESIGIDDKESNGKNMIAHVQTSGSRLYIVNEYLV